MLAAGEQARRQVPKMFHETFRRLCRKASLPTRPSHPDPAGHRLRDAPRGLQPPSRRAAAGLRNGFALRRSGALCRERPGVLPVPPGRGCLPLGRGLPRRAREPQHVPLQTLRCPARAARERPTKGARASLALHGRPHHAAGRTPAGHVEGRARARLGADLAEPPPYPGQPDPHRLQPGDGQQAVPRQARCREGIPRQPVAVERRSAAGGALGRRCHPRPRRASR